MELRYLEDNLEGGRSKCKTESHLVEVLNGIETVKSQNVEIKTRWKWQELYSKYINRNFEKTITGTTLYKQVKFYKRFLNYLFYGLVPEWY